jgi:hypothetical protein
MVVDKKILVRLYISFIPIAYFSYLFHEFGHWIVGIMHKLKSYF